MTRILTTICCALALWALTATAARADAKLYARSSALAEGRGVKGAEDPPQIEAEN